MRALASTTHRASVTARGGARGAGKLHCAEVAPGAGETPGHAEVQCGWLPPSEVVLGTAPDRHHAPGGRVARNHLLLILF